MNLISNNFLFQTKKKKKIALPIYQNLRAYAILFNERKKERKKEWLDSGKMLSAIHFIT